MHGLEKKICTSRRTGTDSRRTLLRTSPGVHSLEPADVAGVWLEASSGGSGSVAGLTVLERTCACGPGRLADRPGDEVTMAPE